MSAYTNAKGVIVSEGTTAYVRVDGKTVATLGGGVYEFKEGIAQTEQGGNAIQRAWHFVSHLFEKKPDPQEEEKKALILNLQKAAAFTIVI